MDSGLSLRMRMTLEEITAAAAAPPTPCNLADDIDLSSAQNEVTRPELLKFLKSVVADKLTDEVCVTHCLLGDCTTSNCVNRCLPYLG